MSPISLLSLPLSIVLRLPLLELPHSIDDRSYDHLIVARSSIIVRTRDVSSVLKPLQTHDVLFELGFLCCKLSLILLGLEIYLLQMGLVATNFQIIMLLIEVLRAVKVMDHVQLVEGGRRQRTKVHICQYHISVFTSVSSTTVRRGCSSCTISGYP